MKKQLLFLISIFFDQLHIQGTGFIIYYQWRIGENKRRNYLFKYL